ncbi:MAG: hypothetical protein QGM50_07295, partial [Anaerolineae bacterium]|nr:hypothetical protein [Anaerolineae bacterium]
SSRATKIQSSWTNRCYAKTAGQVITVTHDFFGQATNPCGYCPNDRRLCFVFEQKLSKETNFIRSGFEIVYCFLHKNVNFERLKLK